jgi:hypothetical protein
MDFNQNETPSETPLGAIWWQRKAKETSGCNGLAWGGQYGFGQLGAGYFISGSATSAIDKLLFLTETPVTIAATLSGQNHTGSVRGNGSGYIFGNALTGSSSIRKLSFSSDALSVLSAVAIYTYAWDTGPSESSIAGYTTDGANSGHARFVMKFTFGSESVSGLVSQLSSGHSCTDGAGFSSTSNSYFAAGDVALSAVDKLSFVNDSIASTNGTLYGPYSCRGTESDNSGYIMGGGNGTRTTILKMTFSTDSWVILASTMANGRNDNAQMRGYFSAYSSTTNQNVSVIDKLTFSTDGTSVVSVVSFGNHHDGSATENLS